MRKFILICFVLVLTACSDENDKGTWVAQNIANEQPTPTPIYPAQVAVYSPNSSTTGLVIHQKEREKWVLVNAQQVASHPNTLVDQQMLTLGEIVAIDVVNNMAMIHIRNSPNYDVKALQPFETTKNGVQHTASVAQIEKLLQQAIHEPIDWQQRYEKNTALLKGLKFTEQENFTTYYRKNNFTYNADALKHAALELIHTLNEAIKSKQYDELNPLISSEDVKQELTYLTKPIEAFDIKEATRKGVYYYVTGIDEAKNEVRLTFIKDEHYRLIGTNLIDAEALEDQKVATIDVTASKKLAQLPALEMFVKKQLTAIKIKTTQLTWQLTAKDDKIEVKKDGTTSYHCSDAQIQNKELRLIGCGPQQAIVPIVTFQ